MAKIGKTIELQGRNMTPVIEGVYHQIVDYPELVHLKLGPCCFGMMGKPTQTGDRINPQLIMLGTAGSSEAESLSDATYDGMNLHAGPGFLKQSMVRSVRIDDSDVPTVSLMGTSLLYATNGWPVDLAELFVICVSVALLPESALRTGMLKLADEVMVGAKNHYRHLVPIIVNLIDPT